MTLIFTWAAINGFINDINNSLTGGWILCIPASIFLIYDWVYSLMIPWWKNKSADFPIFWEGGGLD